MVLYDFSMTDWDERRRSNELNLGDNSDYQFPAVMLDLIDTAEMQRMRDVRQLGFVPWTYPGSTHTRFVHSIGTCRDTGLTLDQLADNGFTQAEQFRLALGAAGLFHDVGQFPLSHGLDQLIGPLLGFSHEQISADLVAGDYSLREFLESLPSSIMSEDMRRAQLEVLRRVPLPAEVLTRHGVPPELVAQIIDGARAERKSVPDAIGKNHFLRQLLDGAVFDVDKGEYLVRDPQMTGVHETGFSLGRIVSNLGIVDFEGGLHLAIERGGLEALEHLVATRKKMYPTVYTHRTVVEHEAMFYEAIKRFIKSMHGEGNGEFARRVYLLNDSQFEAYLAQGKDPVATRLYVTAKYDRRNRHRIVYGTEAKTIPSMLDSVDHKELALLQKLGEIGGDFPEDTIRDEILKRANAGRGKANKLEDHDVIVYNRVSKGLRTRADFLRKFDIRVFSGRRLRGDTPRSKYESQGPVVYNARDFVGGKDDFHDEHLDRLFRTFTGHEVSYYFAVLTPKENRERVQRATQDYVADLLK